MTITLDFLIQTRKEKWNKDHDLERDKVFRETVARELINNSQYLEEIKLNPEKMIELIFLVVDKDKKTVPFFLNDIQKDFIGKLKNSIDDYNKGLITNLSFLVLKGRQLGFTLLITAYQLVLTITNRNFEGYTLADVTENSESIFRTKAKFMYDNLPELLKPTEKYNNRRQLIFDKLNSTWEVNSATENVGRSKTINFFHGSECAFWKVLISSIQAGFGEALTKNAIKIYESTANGFNEFQKMWQSGVHINCFYEWYRNSEYKTSFESEEIKKEFINDINTKNNWIFNRLKWLRDEKQLLQEQLYWYYKKHQDYIDKDLIKQEYPCTPEEAFLSSGNCIFDKEKLIHQLEEVRTKKPLRIGYFEYDYDDSLPQDKKISNIRWINDKNGYIKIYETPNIYQYAIGGDTAGEGSDYFTAQVINAATGKQVATLKNQFEEVQYSRQMYCLGKYYDNALIGIESNFSTYPIKELERLGYKNQYIREKEDTYTGRIDKSYGFRTTSITRPLIIGQLQQIVLEHTELINDEETLEEMLTFVKNEKGKPEAQQGSHDDLVMGLAITYYIKNQIIIKNETIYVDQKYNFSHEKPKKSDYGATIKII